MADLAGCFFPSSFPLPTSKPERRSAGTTATVTWPVSSSKPDKRRAGALASFGGGGTTVTHHYKLRARDNGLGPPAVYTEWESTDYTSSPGVPPVGAWVEKTILVHWTT